METTDATRQQWFEKLASHKKVVSLSGQNANRIGIFYKINRAPLVSVVLMHAPEFTHVDNSLVSQSSWHYSNLRRKSVMTHRFDFFFLCLINVLLLSVQSTAFTVELQPHASSRWASRWKHETKLLANPPTTPLRNRIPWKQTLAVRPCKLEPLLSSIIWSISSTLCKIWHVPYMPIRCMMADPLHWPKCLLPSCLMIQSIS